MAINSITLSPHWPRLALIALFLAVPLLYFLFLPVSYSFDGTVFSQMLRYALLKHDWLGVAQIHHLLYFPGSYLAYRFLQACFHYQVLEFFHLQLFSMFFSLATLLLVERVLKKAGMGLWLRLAGVAAVAFSHAFWLYSVDAEVHIPGLCFTLAGIYLLVFRKGTAAALAGTALCFAFAAGFHLTNGLVVGTGVLYLLAGRASWRQVANFLAAFFAFLALLYGGYAALSGRPVLSTLANVLAGPGAFQPPALSTVAASCASLKRALAAGTGFLPWLLGAGFLALLALALRPGAAREGVAFRRAMLCWFLPFFVFFTLWDTSNIEFKIQALLPLLLIAVTGLARLKPVIAAVAGVGLGAGLLLVNLVLAIAPRADIRNNLNYRVAAAIGKATPENAQVMITGNFQGYGYGKIYIPYFARREVIILDWALDKGRSLAEIRGQLEGLSRSGRPVYALTEIAAPGGAMKRLLDVHRLGPGELSRFRSGIRFIAVAALPGGQRLYRLEFPAPAADGAAGLN